VNKKDVVMLPKDTVIAALDGISFSKQMHIVCSGHSHECRRDAECFGGTRDELLDDDEAFRLIESIRFRS